MLAHSLAPAARIQRSRAIFRLGILGRLASKRSVRHNAAQLRAMHEHALANAVDWAVAYSRHLYGPAHTVTPEDVQLRAWADFNLDVSCGEAARAIARYANR